MYHVIVILNVIAVCASYVQKKYHGARKRTGTICQPLDQSSSGEHRGHSGVQFVPANQGKQPGVSHFLESG